LAAGASLQIFALRRHKSDDYRGRYRIWLWSALVLTLASADTSADLHRMVRGLMVYWTGRPLGGNGTLWPWLVCGVPVAIFGVCLLIEMRRARPAAALLMLAALSYAVGAGFSSGLIRLAAVPQPGVPQATTLMLGHALVLISVWTYARHVYREAHNLIAVRAIRSAKTQAAAATSSRPGGTQPPASCESDQVAAEVNQQIDREQLASLEEELEERSLRSRLKTKSRVSKPPNLLKVRDDQYDEADERRLSKRERREIKRMRRQRRAA
jgi:hypothetical protein